MDPKIAAILAGQTALLSEIVRLLVERGVLARDDIQAAATEVAMRARSGGAPRGADVSAMHFLSIVQQWDKDPPGRG